MGAGFDPTKRIYDCNGEQVTAKLNQVFKNPGPPGHLNPKFKFAKDHNTFDQVPHNQKGNWNALFNAYITAGVDVQGLERTAWKSYLEDLGKGEDGEPGPQQISTIAKIRFDALNNDTGIDTKTHPHGHLQTSQGVIDSPCPMGP
jgi:hypothetical protein